MQEIRFSYYPKDKLFLLSDFAECHGDTIAKRGKKIPFDVFIRGIIKENVLYFRLYYPLKDIDEKTGQEIKDYSFDVLFDQLKPILKALKAEGIKKPSKIAYNVTNDDLRGIIANI